MYECSALSFCLKISIKISQVSVNILFSPVQTACVNSQLLVCVCFLAGSAVTAVWQDTNRRVPPRGSALHTGWPGWPQRWRRWWHQRALLLSWHDPERPRALRERAGEGRKEREGGRQKSCREGAQRRVTAREKRSGLETEREEKKR